MVYGSTAFDVILKLFSENNLINAWGVYYIFRGPGGWERGGGEG